MAQRLAKRVLVVGWDAADWKLINPLVDQGLMPTLESVINQGVIGNIATLQPVLSPMLWNSIATGKTADKHGILNFTEPDPMTGGVRPVSSTSRKVKAIWNMLMQRGLRSHVIGWWAGHPAEPIDGVCVSLLYQRATVAPGQPWPLPVGTIHPERVAAQLAELRIAPAEIRAEELLAFVPRAAEIDQEKDRHLAVIAKNIAETCSVHNAATWALENEPWDFAAVYYDAIDHFGHGFMHYHPPRGEGVPEREFEMYREVMTAVYRFHDMMLERLLALAGPDTTLILVSDHGFHSDHLRPRHIPQEPAGPAVSHRLHGIVCMAGPGIRKDERIYGANLLDVTPTVLTLFGLPVGADMDGKVLVQAFESAPEIETIPSWENEPGDCGMHCADLRMDPAAAKAILDQFVALGYMQPPGKDQAEAVETAVRESDFNLARVYLTTGRPRLALPLLRDLHGKWTEVRRFAANLAQCHIALGENAEARAVVEGMLATGPSRPFAEYLLGVLEFAEGASAEALDHLLRAEQENPGLPELQLRIGNTYLRRRLPDEAARAFENALRLDAENARAHLGLARVSLRLRRNEEAAWHALEAVGLEHMLPLGHFVLGMALARLGHLDRAIRALEVALSLEPGLVDAHRLLAAIHRTRKDIGRAAYHQALAAELRSKAKP